MTHQTEVLAAEVKRLAEDMADAACANVAGEFVERQRKPLHEAIDRLAALSAPAPQVLAPEDVLKAAQYMVENDYRGPLAYARKVFDWVAALSSQPPAPRELTAMIQAVNAAIQEAIVAARDCQGVPHIYGRSTPDWDDGYLQGIQCCATIVQAAMHHSARASLTATAGSTP